MTASIRKLGPADVAAVRNLRLEALRLFPSHFGTAWEEEADKPLAWWENRLAGPARTLGATVDGHLVGMVVVSLKSRVKASHVAEIGAMYVRSEFHRRGVGRTLMQSAMETITSGEFAGRARIATLNVSAINISARKLYESFGFVLCGQLERELNVDGTFYDELLMRARIS